MELGVWSYVAIFVSSAILCWGLTPLALRVAMKKGILDHPRDYKVQTSPVPYLGGAALVLAFAGAVLIAAAVRGPRGGIEELPWIITLGIGLSIIGLIDDIGGLPPSVRFLAQAAAAITLWFAGVQILLVDNTPLNIALTVLWIVGITNAFNLLDNMDGLSAGVATIASLGFFAIAALNGQFLVAALAVALAGCALGFLRHNFHPAKIYMGDAGSLFIGFLLAVIAVKLRFEGPVEVTFMVPILVLAVPLFDTALVISTRLIHRRNPFSGGRDHASHRLVFVGIPVGAAVALIYLAAIASSWLAIVMSRVDVATGVVLLGFVLTVGLFLGVMLGMVPVYETSKRRRLMIREVVDHEDPSDLRQPGEPAPSPEITPQETQAR